jgi:type VI secretion system secreted protein Hcp
MNGTWDAFLTVEGVTGESRRTGHEGEIELISFDFGAVNPTSVGQGTGGGSGKVSLTTFNFLKQTDAASVELFLACCNGQHFPTAKVTLYKAGGSGGALDYLIYEFEEVFVDSINWSGSEGGNGIPMEAVSFAFGKITVTYNQQDESGNKSGGFVASYDVRTSSWG